MKNIRQQVFETNSSSTHSICIASPVSEDMMQTLPVNDEGTVEVFPDEYGWEYENYTDAVSKASYVATYLMNDYGSNTERFKEMFVAVIKRQTGADKVEIREVRGYSPDNTWCFHKYGYIDHQSEHCIEEVFESEEVLKQYLFNPHSSVTTDNDNH